MFECSGGCARDDWLQLSLIDNAEGKENTRMIGKKTSPVVLFVLEGDVLSKFRVIGILDCSDITIFPLVRAVQNSYLTPRNFTRPGSVSRSLTTLLNYCIDQLVAYSRLSAL